MPFIPWCSILCRHNCQTSDQNVSSSHSLGRCPYNLQVLFWFSSFQYLLHYTVVTVTVGCRLYNAAPTRVKPFQTGYTFLSPFYLLIFSYFRPSYIFRFKELKKNYFQLQTEQSRNPKRVRWVDINCNAVHNVTMTTITGLLTGLREYYTSWTGIYLVRWSIDIKQVFKLWREKDKVKMC